MKFEIILGRIFLSVISIILAFILIDYASLWFLPKSSSPVEREFNVGELRKPKPYVMFGGTPNVDYYAKKGEKLNSLGYRGKEPLSGKDRDEYRIFLLGGSTVLFGDPPVAVLLEDEFRLNGYKNVNVYNFGVISSVSGMELSRILFEISDLEPDLIVMYNGGNDIMQPFYYDPRPGYPFNFIAYESNPLIEGNIETYPKWDMLAYGSNIFRYLFPTYFVNKFVPLDRMRNEVKYISKEWSDSIAKIYVNNLVKANKVSNALNAQFIVFFQPLAHFKEPLSDEEKKYVSSGEKDHYLYIREIIRAKLYSNKTNTSPMVQVIDMSDFFDGISDTVFSDKIHILQKNQKLIALEIYNYLNNKVRIAMNDRAESQKRAAIQ